MTQVTQEVIDYIAKSNAEDEARMAATPGLWCGMIPSSLDFLEQHKLYTVYDLELFYALSFYCEVHKDLYHYNCSWEGLTLIQVNMLIDQFPRYTDHVSGELHIGYEEEEYTFEEMESNNFKTWTPDPAPANNVFADLLK
jgi:hypothetical protein